MTPADPRLTLARPDLAALGLEGVVAASRYQATRAVQVVVPVAPLRRTADAAAERLDELIYGELFDSVETQGDFVWGQARRDGYVGFVASAALAPIGPAPTHRVTAVGTYAFAEPAFKAPAVGPFSLNALVRIDEVDGDYGRADGRWFWMPHLAPVGTGFEPDRAGVAERFCGAPYLWSGRTAVGLDCSGLVQQSFYACGLGCPRDADQQARLGLPTMRDYLARGDLACWPGHIGVMLDSGRLIHANTHHMAVAIEPLDEAVSRIGAAPSFRRL